MKKLFLALGMCLAASHAMAEDITIELDNDAAVTEDSQLYRCGDQDVSATYYSAKDGDISLVKLEFDDKTVIASRVLSGSGVKYAGDVYYWWTKGGEEANLYNIMENPEQDKPVACTVQ